MKKNNRTPISIRDNRTKRSKFKSSRVRPIFRKLLESYSHINSNSHIWNTELDTWFNESVSSSMIDEIRSTANDMEDDGYDVEIKYEGLYIAVTKELENGEKQDIFIRRGDEATNLMDQVPRYVTAPEYILWWVRNNIENRRSVSKMKRFNESVSSSMIDEIRSTANDMEDDGYDVEIKYEGLYIAVTKELENGEKQDIFFTQGDEASDLLDEVPRYVTAPEYILWWVRNNIE